MATEQKGYSQLPLKGDSPTGMFALTANQEDVNEALRCSLSSVSGQDTTHLPWQIQKAINLGRINREQQRWFNAGKFVGLFLELNAVEFWENLLSKSQPDIQSGVLAGGSGRQAAEGIHRALNEFMVLPIAASSLAAAAGTDIRRIIKPRWDASFPYIGVWSGNPTIGYDAAIAIGERYQTRAQNPEELLARMHELFPDPASDGTRDNSLLNQFFLL